MANELGKVAYTTHQKSMGMFEDTWMSWLDDSQRNAWTAAAQAVADEVNGADYRPDIIFTRGYRKGRQESENPLRDAVVEAARECNEGRYSGSVFDWCLEALVAADSRYRVLEKLRNAIEALERAEKEE